MLALPRFLSHELRPLARLLEDPFLEPSSSLFRSSHLNNNNLNTFTPSFDVKETKEAYVLDGEVPGISDKSALDLSFVDDNTLVIKGRIEKHNESGNENGSNQAAESHTDKASGYHSPTVEEEGSNSQAVSKTTSTEVQQQQQQQQPQHRYWIRERYVGEFQRSFSFPQNVDHDAVKASLKDGILSVVVPKKAHSASGRKITVQ